ncbi:MAG: type II toxin-antitoxin system VapC family toxin [Pirellulaceae bacterium]
MLDTNVVSELRKGPRCDPAVAAWEDAELVPHGGAISVITIGEIRKGIDLIAQRDPQQAAGLESWLAGLCQHFTNRILPISREVAEEWGRLNALRPLPAVDSLLGATANVYALILATRNVRDLRDVGLPVVNPFEFGADRPDDQA